MVVSSSIHKRFAHANIGDSIQFGKGWWKVVGIFDSGGTAYESEIYRAGLQAMMSADLPDPGLAVVAEQTGGGYTEIRYGEDLGAAFAKVADELHSQYLIGYAPPKRDGKVHAIDVRVSQHGMKPRARKNYVAPKEQQ